MTIGGGLSAQAFADIHNLYAYYNLSSDAGDAEGYASTFTRDGILRNETFDTTVRGHEALVAFKNKDYDGRRDKYRRHWNGSLYLEKLDETMVRGRCYLQAFNGIPGEFPEVTDIVVYEDTITNTEGEWKFAKRILRVDASHRLKK